MCFDMTFTIAKLFGKIITGRDPIEAAILSRSFKMKKGILPAIFKRVLVVQFKDDHTMELNLDWTIPNIERITTSPMYAKFASFTGEIRKKTPWEATDDGLVVGDLKKRTTYTVYRDKSVIYIGAKGFLLESK